MNDPRSTPTATATRTEVSVHRQPVVRPDRSVHGYAVNVVVRTPLATAGPSAELDASVQAAYADLDLTLLAHENVAFLRATTAMLTGEARLPRPAGGLVLEVPPHFATLPDAAGHLARIRDRGVGLALADYAPGVDQDALLPLVDFVKVDLGRGLDAAAIAIDRAHDVDVTVIAERVASEAAVHFCLAQGVELLQGPLFQRDAATRSHEFTAGQVQCLQLLQLLHDDPVDLEKVIRLVDSDPELAIRTLALVNSSASGLPRHIDSLRQAVVLAGVGQLAAIAAASLVDASSTSISGLWFMLSRAMACRTLGGDDAAYTVGLLSAVAAQLRIEPANLIARTGVSEHVADALLHRSGPYGPALAAVLAHEENDHAGVDATGLAPIAVADAYLDAVADALTTAKSLAS